MLKVISFYSIRYELVCLKIWVSFIIQYVPANSQPKISESYIFTCLDHETYKLGQYYQE